MAVGKDCDDKNSKRSKNYADMPQLVVADTCIVFGCYTYFMNYIYNIKRTKKHDVDRV